jgi:hypothetical protein
MLLSQSERDRLLHNLDRKLTADLLGDPSVHDVLGDDDQFHEYDNGNVQAVHELRDQLDRIERDLQTLLQRIPGPI